MQALQGVCCTLIDGDKMTEALILEKLEKMEKKVDRIEDAVGLIAVQTERINNISTQVNALWRKYDDAFAPDGVVTKVKNFQASCPRDQVKLDLGRQWKIIAFLAVIVTGSLLKAFGVM